MRRSIVVAASLIVLLWSPGVTQAKPTAVAKCAVAKRTAVLKHVAGTLRCRAAADLKARPVDPVCLAKVEVKFAKAIEKAESKHGCLQDGDAVALDAKAETFVAGLLIDLPPVCFGFNHFCTAHDECCAGSCTFIVGPPIGVCD